MNTINNEQSMVALLASRWWMLALRGVLAILFGLTALLWPAATLDALVWLFGAYAAVDGIFALVAALTGDAQPTPRWWLILAGIVGIAIGVLTFVWPGVTALALLYLIAAHAIVIGMLHIVAAIQLRKEIEGEWWLILNGIIALLFGIGVVIYPGAGALALITVIGVYALLAGLLLTGLGWRVRSWRQLDEQPVAKPA